MKIKEICEALDAEDWNKDSKVYVTCSFEQAMDLCDMDCDQVAKLFDFKMDEVLRCKKSEESEETALEHAVYADAAECKIPVIEVEEHGNVIYIGIDPFETLFEEKNAIEMFEDMFSQGAGNGNKVMVQDPFGRVGDVIDAYVTEDGDVMLVVSSMI